MFGLTFLPFFDFPTQPLYLAANSFILYRPVSDPAADPSHRRDIAVQLLRQLGE
jgi:hypothetical protein